LEELRKTRQLVERLVREERRSHREREGMAKEILDKVDELLIYLKNLLAQRLT